MTNNISITPAQPADVADIHQLILDLAEYEKLSHMVVGTPQQLARYLFGDVYSDATATPAQHPIIEAMIARQADGKAIGFMLWYTTYSTFLAKPGIHLEDLFVIPEARGKGIGKQLLIELARIARSRDCGRLEWNVLDWNTPSIEFYKSLGGALMPEWILVRMTHAEIKQLAA
jgi:GNAT superfamily N-acetyltransferase